MDNSAAQLFGFGGGTDDKKEDVSNWGASHTIAEEPGMKKNDPLNGSSDLTDFFQKSNSDSKEAADALPPDKSKSFLTSVAVDMSTRKEPPSKKKSFLDDSDSDSDSEDQSKVKISMEKSEESIAPAPSTESKHVTMEKRSFLDDSERDDNSQQPPKPTPAPAAESKTMVKKKSFLDDSDSDDSSTDSPKGRKMHAIPKVTPQKKSESTVALVGVKKSDESDSSDDSSKESPRTNAGGKGTEKKGAEKKDGSRSKEFGDIDLFNTTGSFNKTDPFGDRKSGLFIHTDNSGAPGKADPFSTNDTADPFGRGDPFKKSDPFDQSNPFDKNDALSTNSSDKNVTVSSKEGVEKLKENDWNAALLDIAAEEKAKKNEKKNQWEGAFYYVGIYWL
jgi:hypothetical protein